MGRLNQTASNTGAPIGRHGLLDFIEQLNAKRAQLGISARYIAVERDGVLTMKETWRAPEQRRPVEREGSVQRISQALPSAYGEA